MSHASEDQLLLDLLTHSPEHTLWLADENVLHLVHRAPDSVTLLTNRWDIQARAQQLPQRHFSDWDLTALSEPARIQRVVYQVSKEKAVVAHLINEIADRLAPGTEILMLGRKNEGIKTLATLAAARLQGGKLKKTGNLYVATFAVAQAGSPPVDDMDYARVRPILTYQGQTLRSKPGTFGWQKLDEGSLLLLATLAEHRDTIQPRRILDLGCGYGLLTAGAQALLQEPGIEWLATDNCAAALACTTANCDPTTQVFAGDRGLDTNGSPLAAPVDLILCNPPFHQGFDATGDLTDKFLQATHRWLTRDGRAIWVVNRFVGVEKRLAGRFRQCQTLADNGSFRVLLLSERV
ncbi:methyltransferase [Simiduia agarivorans]|uniref:Ribosomal RNA small subunit methyltransferase C n=1 Tax=Simiduia agarivorans (strain DSM 21679 / JCM 13881 / BCRC 17597 / SA1) TaxID=1117647 RepID=K4KHH4_SIMAS|nr:methyltransferase [Simiduia agarivorans]AFU97408.1 putative ribosomal RNA small subunit methyltransferase C [Simiduia agarivorans SA1 = DSM 21679]